MKKLLLISIVLSVAGACGKSTANNACGDDTNACIENNPANLNNVVTQNSNPNSMSNGCILTEMLNNGVAASTVIEAHGNCWDDTTLYYCDEENSIIEVDCVAEFGPAATCTSFESAATPTGWDSECAVTEGEACEFFDEDKGDFTNVYCGGDDAACIWSGPDAATCVNGFATGSCTVESFAPSCEGEVFLFDCYGDQPVGVDCSTLGTAAPCDAARGCVMSTGGPCDDTVIVCDTGLTCTIPDGERVGTCG